MPQRKAFENIRVLDFTWVGVGPITTKYLADHGATVLRVESASHPDLLRTLAPFKDGVPGINRSQFAANFNTNKLNLGLDMSKSQARELIRRIIGQWRPDIIAESFTPKVMRNWDLDYEHVKELKPDVVYFSACQQGQTGPYSSYAGYGELAAAMAGYYHITGWPDRDLIAPYGAYSDFVNPPNAFGAIVAALEYRRRTGKGQHIDLAQLECAAHFMAPALMDYASSGRIMARNGNRDDTFVPHGVYPCKESPSDDPEVPSQSDHWCVIAVSSDQEWRDLCEIMGYPGWCLEDRYATFSARRQHEDDLDRLISRWTSRFEAKEVMEMCQRAGVPSGVVQSQTQLWSDPQLKHQEYFRWLDHVECGPMPYDGLQFQLSKTPGEHLNAHALIGQHNEMVLKEFAGLTDEEIGQLVIDEVLETS